MTARPDPTDDTGEPSSRARRRARYLVGLLWHIGAFAIVNVAFWLLDALGPGGIDWAYWITAIWGFALAFHALAWSIDGRDLEARLTERYRDRESGERE